MLNMKYFLIYLFSWSFLILMVTNTMAQDKHFTQFYASPQTLNPALTGAYNGKYRIGMNYRDQWRAVLDEPISTYAFSGDLKYELDYNASSQKDFFALGVLFFSDRVAKYDLNTNQVALTLAYQKALSKQYNQYLSIGYQIGVSQKNINYEDIFFEDQFNNIDGYTLNTSETLPSNNFGYADMGLGLNYSLQPTDHVQISMGGSLYHFNSVNVSFWKKSDDASPGLVKKDIQHIKYAFQAASTIQLKPKIRLSPRVLFSAQGGHWESNLGANVRFAFNSFTPSGFYLGSWIRPVRFEDGAGIDALVLFTGIDYDSFLFGLSYDANFTDLVQDQKGIGAFEFSVTFLGLYENDSAFCPEF